MYRRRLVVDGKADSSWSKRAVIVCVNLLDHRLVGRGNREEKEKRIRTHVGSAVHLDWPSAAVTLFCLVSDGGPGLRVEAPFSERLLCPEGQPAE